MASLFSSLSETEYNDIKNAFARVAILVAGAEGKISKSELAWVEKVVNIRSYNLKGYMKEFYKDLNSDFHERLENVLNESSQETSSRQSELTLQLESLNKTLAKLDQKTGAQVYNGLISLAKHVATADGGILGFFTINSEEAKIIDLPMITPIDMPEGEEEE
jgi:tellurite resistance protein